VVANVGAALASELAPTLTAWAGDVVILSGLLEEVGTDVPAGYGAFVVVGASMLEGWRCLVLQLRR
jgi:ribosomal protein L11 methylase PrmA